MEKSRMVTTGIIRPKSGSSVPATVSPLNAPIEYVRRLCVRKIIQATESARKAVNSVLEWSPRLVLADSGETQCLLEV